MDISIQSEAFLMTDLNCFPTALLRKLYGLDRCMMLISWQPRSMMMWIAIALELLLQLVLKVVSRDRCFRKV